jgi:hypothetical protein
MYVLQKFVIPLYKQVRYAIICLSHFGLGFEDTGAARCARDLLRPLCLKGIQGYPSHGKTKLLEDWTGDDIGLPEESG